MQWSVFTHNALEICFILSYFLYLSVISAARDLNKKSVKQKTWLDDEGVMGAVVFIGKQTPLPLKICLHDWL